MNATMKENKTMTPRQRLERWETELRLARRRRQRAMEAERPRRRAETLPAVDPAPAEDPWAEAVQAEAVKAESAKTENIQAEAVQAEAVKSEPVKAEARKAEAPKGRSHKLGRKARAVRESDSPVVYAPVVEKSAGKEAVPAFTGNLSEWMAHVRRRLRSIRREEKARRFPESNRLPVQLLLFFRGMLPMLGSHLREAAAQLPGHHLRAALEVSGPAVVAKALPELHEPLLRGLGQNLHRGEGREEAVIVPQHRRHPGLLEHNL